MRKDRQFWPSVVVGIVLTATTGASGDPAGAGPLGFAPTSGSIEGGRLVFVDVDEGPTRRGRAMVACRFGSHAPIRASYDLLDTSFTLAPVTLRDTGASDPKASLTSTKARSR